MAIFVVSHVLGWGNCNFGQFRNLFYEFIVLVIGVKLKIILGIKGFNSHFASRTMLLSPWD
jgi:hypothetical protein